MIIETLDGQETLGFRRDTWGSGSSGSDTFPEGPMKDELLEQLGGLSVGVSVCLPKTWAASRRL